MLILAIDTSGRQGSVALARGDDRSFELIQSVPIQGGTFSAELVPQIAELLAQHNLKKEHINAFAAASGPGSFTGLRVGLAAIKALAEILEKPIAAVSMLEAVAATQNDYRDQEAVWESDAKANVAAALDAGRGEVYVGEYSFGRPLPVLVEEKVVIPQELARMVEQRGQKLALVTPDQHIIDQIKKLLRDPYILWARHVAHPGSAGVARLGIAKVLAGKTVSVDELDANYVRRSDAEIFSLPKILGKS
jgi:tRNA threonylcarbamoyladenosine biosynthesis protein TsaB